MMAKGERYKQPAALAALCFVCSAAPRARLDQGLRLAPR